MGMIPELFEHQERNGNQITDHLKPRAPLFSDTKSKAVEASKSLESTNAWMMLKSNDQPKDYQGRQAGGRFGSGTEGGTKDHKEQELRDRDSGKGKKNASGKSKKLAKEQPPVDKREQLVKDARSAMIARDVARDYHNRAVAGGRHDEVERTRKDYDHWSSEVDKRIQAVKDHDSAPKVEPITESPTDPSKMQMVHGKRDELSSSLGQTAIGQQGHLATIKNLYDNYKDRTYQQINDSVAKIGDSLGSSQLKKLAQDFGVNDSGSKSTIIGAIQRKITDRKASAERTAEIGAKPQPQASATKLPESVSPTIPHKQTGERPEFEGLRLDSKDKRR